MPKTKAATLADTQIKKAMSAFEDLSDKRPLTFTLTEGNPTLVRVIIRHTEIDPIKSQIVMINGQSWPSVPRPKGRRLKVEIQVDGGAGPVVITVTNGKPSPLPDIYVPAGYTGDIIRRLVIADWV